MLRKRRGMSNIDVQYVPVTHKSRADGTNRSGRVGRAHVDAQLSSDAQKPVIRNGVPATHV